MPKKPEQPAPRSAFTQYLNTPPPADLKPQENPDLDPELNLDLKVDPKVQENLHPDLQPNIYSPVTKPAPPDMVTAAYHISRETRDDWLTWCRDRRAKVGPTLDRAMREYMERHGG